MKLRQLRISQRITQSELAELAGITQVTVSHVECNTHPPTIDTMLKVSRALGVELIDIDEFKQRIAA